MNSNYDENVNEIDPDHIVDIKTVQSSAIKILIEALKEILTDTNIILVSVNISFNASINILIAED